ncbi:SH3 domain-containing protein [Anabaena sp. CA = ATCC 33047]|uniref:SH3 domain-containing protein n=1 Tax=Anabaena sp. (strain CA / ATCC 33047) TaxID=52271 RepID=UPI000836889C|nr:SH3 domain-containing protein [Anabaena sp. CA = ATCC 33047]
MFSGLLKFILGFLLAIAVLVGSGVAVALYFINRTAIPPARPIFANDSPSVKNSDSPNSDVKNTPTSTPTTSPTPTASPSPSPSPTSEELPPGAYRGTVTWAEGVRLRGEANQDAQTVGGVGFNEKIIVLEESQDKNWVKIRSEASQQEGWIKVGNIKRDE